MDLCGNFENHPPVLDSSRNRKLFRNMIEKKVSWISDTYLRYYGILVIDGYDPEFDWVDDDAFFGQLLDMPVGSIYWFGAPDELGDNATDLINDGILTVEAESFYEHMQRHMPELLQEDVRAVTSENDPTLYTPLTLRLGDKQTRSVYISRADISDVTGANLCVIDDDVLAGGMPTERGRAVRFADFLSQKDVPNWHLFDAKPNEIPFYIPRDQDALLERKVYEALKETGVGRKPIILSGPSNSGKSMMLANLALTVAKRRKYPVIFIRGELMSGAEKRLSDFIANWFNNVDRFDGERVEKILVIWDGGGLKYTEKDYAELQKTLFNRNAQVVGSLYTSARADSIKLDQELSAKESGYLQKLLASLGSTYVERFNEVSKRRRKVAAFENNSLLYLLQAVFKYEFNSEYKAVSDLLKSQFKQEQQYAEWETGKSVDEYVETFFKTQKKILSDGVGSSLQEQLKLVLARMAVEEREAAPAQTDKEKLKEEKKEKLQRLSQCIAVMNSVLALASEFGVSLPLSLLLKLLRDERGNAYVSYGEETSKIVQILRSDTLINFASKSHPTFGDNSYVSFRNPMEAENYICLMCELPLDDHSEKRKEKEVALLKQIIESADDGAELWSVIELIRQFGPNGHGMLSELEWMRTKKDYLEYHDYWLEIAETLIARFPHDPEAVLLYSHLTREYIVREKPDHKTYYSETYAAVRTRLEGVLRQMDDNCMNESSQYARLSVELCANYQQTMRENGYNAVGHAEIKKRIREAFRRSKRQDATDLRRDFSSNSLLDILINAYFTYRESVKYLQPDDQELLQIVCDIDDMMNLDDLNFERTDLLRKVKDVYSDLGDAMERTDALKEKLSNMKSDAFLYLQARMMWQADEEAQAIWRAATGDSNSYMDYYSLIVGRDIPYNREIPEALMTRARVISQQVIQFLNDNEEAIRKTRSERCVAMLLRANWFAKTGMPMLAEKQRVALTRGEWNAVNALCDRYHAYRDAASYEACIPAYFLKGVYAWIYGNPKEAGEWFAEAKSNMRGDQGRTVERLVLCAEGTEMPRTFVLNVQRNDFGKYTASIARETTKGVPAVDGVASRYGMGVSDAVLKYLFDGTRPKEQRQQSRKEGVIRFNLIGAQVGIPMIGGYEDEQ